MNPRAKFNFEIDQASLANANAKACVARHGGSLNKLVSSLFATLGQKERLASVAIDPTRRVLLDASTGKLSIIQAAELLGLPDAGYALHRLADVGLPLPRLTEDEVQRQAAASLDALNDCRPAPSRRRANPQADKRR